MSLAGEPGVQYNRCDSRHLSRNADGGGSLITTRDTFFINNKNSNKRN